MNCSKLQPIVQDKLIDNSDDLLCDHDELNYTKGTLVITSGIDSFIMTAPEKICSTMVNTGTRKKPVIRKLHMREFTGRSTSCDYKVLYCPLCNCQLNRNGTVTNRLAHLPIGGDHTSLVVTKQRFTCSNSECTYSWDEQLDFKADNHFITKALENYICSLLRYGYTLKEVSLVTGVNVKVIKAIDKRRLELKYTVDGEGKQLKAPVGYSRLLGIDEFLLHKGHKYATLILDLETGHVLYIAHGKKKKTVQEFEEYVGEEWLSHVEAVACDMNSDFFEEFNRLGIPCVFDFFHIVKNFNDKVVAEVRKDEQRRLISEGKDEEAKTLKHSKYILMTTKATRQKKEKDAEKEKVIRKKSVLFNESEVKARSGIEERYAELIKANDLFFKLDIIKETLRIAYICDRKDEMKEHIDNIVDICKGTENEHFIWFSKLLENHIDGILNHAQFNISSGKVEGTNNMIKTLRRTSYGLPDDEYFFLKIMDASRKDIHWME